MADPYDPNTYSYQWALPPPPPAPARKSDFFGEVANFFPNFGLGAYDRVVREAPAAARVSSGVIAQSAVEGANNPVSSVLRSAVRAGLDLVPGGPFVQAALPGLAGIVDRSAQDVSRPLDRAIPNLPVGISSGLDNYARRQYVQAEEGRRQYQLDNPRDPGLGADLGYSFGGSLGQMGVALGAGGLAGIITRSPAIGQSVGTSVMYGQNLSNNISAQQQARGIDTDIDTARAARAAVAQTGTDLVLGRFMGGGDITRSIMGGTFGRGVTRGAVAGGLSGAAQEGAAEVIQQALEREQAGLSLTSKNAVKEYGTAFLMGGLLGGGMGAATGAFSSAADARQALADSPAGIVTRAENERQSGAENRLRSLMAETDADAAYAQLNPSPFAEGLTGLDTAIRDVVGGEIADGRQAARIIRDRQQGEMLALPAPDPMKYDPSGVTARPATPEEYRLAQQIGGQPGVDQVLALPNPNTSPIQVAPDGTAVRTDDMNALSQRDSQVLPIDRQRQRISLIQAAAANQRTQSEPVSPFDTKAMLSVRGKPAYTVTVVGQGAKPGTVKVFNNDTRKMVEVPRSRVVSIAEPRDPATAARIPLRERKLEEARAKELHTRQIEAILNPALADELNLAQDALAVTAQPVSETPVSLTDQDGRVSESNITEPETASVPEMTSTLAALPEEVAQDPAANIYDRPLDTEGYSSYRVLDGGKYTRIAANSAEQALADANRWRSPVDPTTRQPWDSPVDPTTLEVWDGSKYVSATGSVANIPQSAATADTRSSAEKMQETKAAIKNAAKVPFAERQRLAQVGETQAVTVPELAQQSPNVQRAELKAAQSTTGPAITNPNGPELSAAAEPMSTTDDDAVFAIEQVQAAALDPNFRSQLMIAMREEFRALGFNGRVPVQLNFTDAAGPGGMLTTKGGKATITIALGLANDMKNIPSAVQALRPFLTHEVVEFAQKFGLLEPDERATLLSYAKKTEGPDGKTLYETVTERYGDLAKANNEPESYLEREAIAYATEYLTRLNPQEWSTSPDNPAPAARTSRAMNRGRTDPRARTRPSPETAAASNFKAKLKALGSSIWKALSSPKFKSTAPDPDIARKIALRLAKGDIAYRARTDSRFTQEVTFSGWSIPPSEVKILGDQLRVYLDSMGLPDVGLRIATSVLKGSGKSWSAAGPGTAGSYFARTITVSMENYNPNVSVDTNLKNLIKVVDHEVIHALRATGAWSPSEWAAISKFVRSAKDPVTGEVYYEKAQRMYADAYTSGMSPAMAQDMANEEAVSMAFADSIDIRVPIPTGPRKLLDRIPQVAFSLARAMHATGRPSAELLMANGNSVSAAVRAGVAAKGRREDAAGPPADIAVKFALADSRMDRVNPAFDPDPGGIMANYNKIDPIGQFERADEVTLQILNIQERDVPWAQKLPGARMFAPLAELQGHDAFKTLKGLTSGSIHELKETTAKLLEEGLKLTAKNPGARDSVFAYLETKGANPFNPRLDNGAKNPAFIQNARLREITIAAKERIRLHGRIAVELGFISQESFDALDGAYLHHMDITSDRKVINSQRFLLPDMSWTKRRRGLSEDERTLRGGNSNPFVSIGTYLSVSGEAAIIDRMYSVMAQVSEVQVSKGGRAWILGAQDMINWRGQDWSPAAVEAEIEFLRGDVTDVSMPAGASDPKQEAKLATIQRFLKESRMLLLRNPLWQNFHGTTPAEIATLLGSDPAQNDTSGISGAKVQVVYDSLLPRTQSVRNTSDRPLGSAIQGAFNGGASFIGNGYVEIPNTVRWGRLRGMSVLREVYDIMSATGSAFNNAVEDRALVAKKDEKFGIGAVAAKVFSPETYTLMHSTFKKFKTVYNPATHGVNWFGNAATFETLGGALPGESLRYSYAAVRQMIKGAGAAYDIVRKYGGMQTGQLASELTTLTDPRIQAALAEALDGFDASDPTSSVITLTRRIQGALNKVDTVLSNSYQLSDTVFKIAKVQMDLDRGLDQTEAFLNAQELYLDYTIVPNWVRFIRMMPMGAPFITWTYLMSGLLTDKLSSSAVIKRDYDNLNEKGEPTELTIPYTFMMMPMAAAIYAASMVFKNDDFEDEDLKYLRVGLPKYTDGGKGLMFTGLDEKGRPVFLDYGKYFAGMTSVRLAGLLDDIQESDTRPGGVAGFARELGLGSDPLSNLFQIWVLGQNPSSMMSVAPQGADRLEGIGSQAAATADLLLPPLFGGWSNGNNSIFGDYGVVASTASRDGDNAGYEQKRPALSTGQKIARIFGFGVFVTDPAPALDKAIKSATQLRAAVQGQMSAISNDTDLSDERRNQKLLEVGKRYERLKAREEELKTMQAEIGPFYARLRAAAIEKGAVDPAITDAKTMQERRQRTSKEDTEEALAVVKALRDAR